MPRSLRSGDTVRLVSPASPPDRSAVQRTCDRLRAWGLTVEIGEHALSKRGYLAGADADRLADLNRAFRDPAVRAIIATRGGKGSYRIADGIDFDAARADPKFLVGFSDISILQMSLWSRCGLAAVHGALFDSDEGRSLQQVLMTQAPFVIDGREDEPTRRFTTAGRAQGILLGGNLEMIATAAGWCLPRLDGAILLIEVVNQGIGAIDRQLTMLRKAGHLAGLAGIAVGQFTGVSDDTFDMVAEHLDVLGVPVLGGLPLGHGQHAECILVGAPAVLDAGAGRLVVSRPSQDAT